MGALVRGVAWGEILTAYVVIVIAMLVMLGLWVSALIVWWAAPALVGIGISLAGMAVFSKRTGRVNG